jgi:translation initiation factor 2 beta subunit (eIF-2beta)/eIF-5
MNILSQEVPTLNFNDIQINSVEKLPHYISKYLKNDHITFIALFKLDKEKNERFIYDGHIVNFAKNKSGEIALLEGQNGKIYKGEEEIVDYLKKYNGFFVYCETKKRRLEEKKEQLEPPKKKQRISGGKKTIKKSANRKKSKKNRKKRLLLSRRKLRA